VAELRRGTVTFVFTDIEGSTRLARLLRDRWPEVRSEHRRLVRAAFAEHGGEEVDTQGDSFFYVFSRARDAALAAADAQRALAAQDWPESGEVRIRVGMHTGEPVVSEEGYHGVGVHRAARIMAAGHGGQVLVSEATAAVLADDELPGLGVRDLGRHRLKDIERGEHLFQLEAEGLDRQFPRVRAAEAHRPIYRRPLVIGAAAGVLAAAVAIPVFALGGGSGEDGTLDSVQDNAVGVVDAESRAITAEAPRIENPIGVAAGRDSVWVTSAAGGGSLVRLDPRTHDVDQTITVGSGPQGVAVNGDDVWVANSLERTVSRVSAQTNREVKRYPVGNTPAGVAVGAGAVWVTNADDGTISALDATTGEPRRTIRVGAPVRGIAFGGGNLWVTDPVGNALAQVAPGGGVAARVPVGSGPTAVAYRNGTVWVANNLDGTVSRIDANSARVTGTFPVGAAPNGLAVTADAVWVTDEVAGTLVRVDPRTGEASRTTLGGRPEGVSPLDGSLWVAVQAGGDAHRGGTLRLLARNFDFIDPARTYLVQVWQLLALTNDGLVGFKRVGGSDGNTLVPDLAVSLPRPSADGKTYTFQLRRGIRFSTGREVRPVDVRHSMERLFKAHPARPDFYEGIVGGAACRAHPATCNLSRGIRVDDRARTITFRLRAPDAEFLYKLALPFAYVVPAGTQSARDAPAVGTGPYRIATYRRKRLVRLVRNDHFRVWSRSAQPEGIPDEIVMQIGGTDRAHVHAVESGKADWLDNVPPDELETARTRFPAQLHITPQAALFVAALNTKRRPFSDVRARRAVAYAFDRARAVERGGGSDLAAPTCQVLPPNLPGYRPYCPYTVNPGSVWTDRDLPRAGELIRRSGTRGALVRVLTPPGGDAFAAAATTLNETLRELGYRVSERVFDDLLAYFDAVLAGGFDAAMVGWAQDYPAPSNFMVSLVGCSNAPESCNPTVERKLRDIRALEARNRQQADEEWAALDREVVDRALVIPVSNGKAIDFVSKRLGNYQRHPTLGLLLGQVWVR
jgi:YVTN family beta-propeller protein